MHDDQLAAEDQLTHSIFGNWRIGILAMGGATCVGGKVSIANLFQLLVPYLTLTQFASALLDSSLNSVGHILHLYHVLG